MAGMASIEPNALRATHWAPSAAAGPSGEGTEPETHWATWVGEPKCTDATLIMCKGLAFIGGDSALEGRPRFFSTRSEHTRLCSLQFVQGSSPVSATSHRSFLSWHSEHAMRPRLRSLGSRRIVVAVTLHGRSEWCRIRVALTKWDECILSVRKVDRERHRGELFITVYTALLAQKTRKYTGRRQAREARSQYCSSHRPTEGEARPRRHHQEESGRDEVGAWQLERRGVRDEVGEEAGVERPTEQRAALVLSPLLGDDRHECGDARAAHSRCEDGEHEGGGGGGEGGGELARSEEHGAVEDRAADAEARHDEARRYGEHQPDQHLG
eukprot:scaffold128220_cov54-Phaeocystis_antarctica.AAC.2